MSKNKLKFVPIRNRTPYIRLIEEKRIIRKLAQGKASHEFDIFTDASVDGSEAAIAKTCPQLPALNGTTRITTTYGLSKEAELFVLLGTLQQLVQSELNGSTNFGS